MRLKENETDFVLVRIELRAYRRRQEIDGFQFSLGLKITSISLTAICDPIESKKKAKNKNQTEVRVN